MYLYVIVIYLVTNLENDESKSSRISRKYKELP